MSTIERIEAWALRAPVETPVSTSFGSMRDRPAVFVRIEDSDGAFGWGEAFANWPAAGAEHRVNLLGMDIAPLLLGREFRDPAELFDDLSERTHLCALQSGEWGPFRQLIAALDIALWDLAARREGLPLARMLETEASLKVPAYASGIHINATGTLVREARTEGYSAFKIKVGFGLDSDIAGTVATAQSLGEGERLFADANQAWNCEQAMKFLDAVAEVGLGWMEEPMPADVPDEEWQVLAHKAPTPLAGGENIAGFDGFAHALALGHLHFLQPDVAKWGGLTGCLRIARETLQAGKVYCPHFLGGGIGLLASAHLLAAAKGPGLLEVDVNPNPLRDAFKGVHFEIMGGCLGVHDEPGLGIGGLPPDLEPLITLHGDFRSE